MTDLDALRHRARALGIEPFYWDNEGNRHETNTEAMSKVVAILEADHARSAGLRLPPVIIGQPGPLATGGGVDQAHLRLADGSSVDVPVSAGQVTISDALPIGNHTLSLTGPGLDESTTIVIAPGRMPRSDRLAGTSGVFVPADALWERESPLPSFRHLGALARALPAHGADVLVTLPLYAGFFDDPFDPSPYAPVSRQHWNEVYLDDVGLPSAPIPRFGPLIDWRDLARRRRAQMLRAAADSDAGTVERVAQFVAANPDVGEYARFRATVAPDPADAGHPAALIEASHRLAQFMAHCQLELLEGEASAALALDLPIGSHPSGFEAWANRGLFAPAVAVGAPPDALFKDGQNWGLPAQLPGEAERTGFTLWRAVVERCGRYSSLLRIDHVLGVNRLWWVPEGMSARDGVYVRYPRHALTSAIAAEAALSGVTLVGEDLGTVPPEMVDLLAEWSMLGLHAERFFVEAPELLPIRPDTVACFRTHDMEPFAALHRDGELDGYRKTLERFLAEPVPDTYDGVLDASLTRLARSDAYVAIADLDDLVAETTPHNVPGTVLPTIWRRRLHHPTSTTLAEPRVRAHLATLSQRTPPAAAVGP